MAWLRARDVIAGEDAVKLGDIKYLPRLDSQSDNEYLGYKSRACFFNATSRTRDGFLGLLFRRDPEVKLPDQSAGVGAALRVFADDVDLMGTSLFTFCKGVVGEVLALGRSGTLIDWAGSTGGQSGEDRAYVVRYAAEDILNWRTQRINGRNVLTMVVLKEHVAGSKEQGDEFEVENIEQIRVLKLVHDVSGESPESTGGSPVLPKYVVEIWQCQPVDGKGRRKKNEWAMVDTRVPVRLGKPLPLIPFVFHGPRNALPDVDKMPLSDIMDCWRHRCCLRMGQRRN